MSPDGDGCMTAGSDGELRVWSIDLAALASDDIAKVYSADDSMRNRGSILASRGVLQRQGNKDRTIGISFHPKQDYIAVHGSDKAVGIWRIRSQEELHKHMQRKRRRRREKAVAAGEALPTETSEVEEAPDVIDVFIPHLIVRTGGRVRSVSWMFDNKAKKSLQLLVASTNNLLETYTVQTGSTSRTKHDTPSDYERALSLSLPGHRTDIRTLSLSSDDRMLASASAGELKVWNLRTKSCLRTLECGTALCSAFLPGDRIVLIGTKEGNLELYDVSSSSLIERVQAHGSETGGGQQAVWTLAVHPDGKSVATGSADKSVKFWRFDIVDEEIPGTHRTTPRLKLTPTRHLKLSDEVLSVAFSPDQRLLAVSTLDNTVKIFFTDSLKLFLTLYGHKLPVLDMSISSDSKLIATCSADKNIRIWGLDFGDCHKAFFAHEDSVMAVSFIPHPVESNEKYILFSASKDGKVKTWDAEKFEQIQKLEGHKGEIWALALGRTGEVVVTASHDRSLRCWEVGDDLVFLEEEREKELEVMYESTLAQNMERDFRDEEAGLGAEDEMATAGKQTIATLTHGEKIMEALEIGIQDRDLMHEYSLAREKNPSTAPPQRNPLFLALGNITAEQHVLNTLHKIPTPSLNDALLVLPFNVLPPIFTFLAEFMNKRMQPELAWRVTYFLLQVHLKQIIASNNRELKALLEEIWQGFEAWQEQRREVLGFNLAGLEILGRDVSESEKGGFVGDVGMNGDEDEDGQMGKGRRKRAFGSLA